MAGLQEVGDARLSRENGLAVAQEYRRDRHVKVLTVVRCPVRRSKVLLQSKGGRELQDAVTVVVGLTRGTDRAVARGHPDVAAGIHHWCRATHPNRALTIARAGVDGEDSPRRSRLAHRDHPTLVRRAVPVVSAHGEDHAAVVEIETGALEQRVGRRAWRVDVNAKLDSAVRGGESDEIVLGAATNQFVGDHEDL